MIVRKLIRNCRKAGYVARLVYDGGAYAWQKAKTELKRIGARIDKRMDALPLTEKG